jgi:hypothetical protein
VEQILQLSPQVEQILQLSPQVELKRLEIRGATLVRLMD